MCERFANDSDPFEMSERFQVHATMPRWRKSWNIAAGNEVPVVIQDSTRRLGTMRWGWHRDAHRGGPILTGRAEDAATKPLLRPAMQRRRCLIAATGWYEWTDECGVRVPYAIKPCLQVFPIAGLWESVPSSVDGHPVGHVVMLTVPASEQVRAIHPRMPAVLLDEHVDQWLDPASSLRVVRSLLTTFLFIHLQAYRVSSEIDHTVSDRRQLMMPCQPD